MIVLNLDIEVGVSFTIAINNPPKPQRKKVEHTIQSSHICPEKGFP